MPFPTRREHRFTLEGQSYCLVGWTRGADRRIRAEYAMAIAAAPAVLDVIDGQDLYAEAVARECLTEAPEIFWEMRPAAADQNGTATRVPTFDAIPLDLWEAFRTEVQTFIALFRPTTPAVTPLAPDAGEGGSDAVAPPETVSPRLRGRAE